MNSSTLILILVSNACTLRKDLSITFNRSILISLIYSIYTIYTNYFLISLSTGIGLYGGLFFVSSITNFFHSFIYVLAIIILLLTSFYSRKIYTKSYMSISKILFYKIKFNNNGVINKMSDMYKILEYPLIILFIINGAVFLICSSDLVSIFISIELQSYGLYLISSIYKNSESSTSGGLMYFLLGGLSSCFILLGSSLLYANSGTTNLDNLYIINNISNINVNLSLINLNGDDISNYNFYLYNSFYIIVSLIIMSTGFLFKLSAAPFHFWSPDVYDAIPTVVTTFVAIIAKVSIFVFLLELVYYLSKTTLNYEWTNNLLLSSLLSLIIGTVLGLTQSRIKRLFAYSTISHLGFILLGLSIHSVESIQAFMFYLIQYSLSNLNGFIILLSIGYTYYLYDIEIVDNKITFNNKSNKNKFTNNKTLNNSSEDSSQVKSENLNAQFNMLEKENSPIQLIDQLKGLFYINPLLALSLSITLFSFAGIPPLIGFFGKMMILSSAIDSGYIFMALVAILTSVISGGYYLYIIKQMYFEKNEVTLIYDKLDKIEFQAVISNNSNTNFEKVRFNYNNIVLSNYLTITIAVLTLITLVFMLNCNEIFNFVNILVILLFKL